MNFQTPADLCEYSQRVLSGEYDMPLPDAPRTVLDLGACVGAFTVWARRQWPECKITAYEPLPEHAKFFELNTNGDGSSLVKAAVRETAGRQSMFRGRNNSGESSFYQSDEQTTDTIEVDCIAAETLPSFEFVKLDIEGAEIEVLPKLNLTDTKGLAIEVHGGKSERFCNRFLLDRGFRIYQVNRYSPSRAVYKYVKGCIPGHTFIALPAYNEIPGMAVNCLIALAGVAPRHLHIRQLVGDSLVTRARNTLTHDFLESCCDRIMFIDADLLFSVEHINRIASHSEDIVGGLYPKKQEGDVAWVVNALPQSPPQRPDGLQEVAYVGTGFLKISRAVFERMIERYGDAIAYPVDHDHDRIEHDFWRVGVYLYADGSKRYLSEDWYFCQLAKDCGYKVWADTRVILKHIGVQIFPNKAQERALFAPQIA